MSQKVIQSSCAHALCIHGPQIHGIYCEMERVYQGWEHQQVTPHGKIKRTDGAVDRCYDNVIGIGCDGDDEDYDGGKGDCQKRGNE